MRWDDLFADLDHQFSQLADAAEDAERADGERVEVGRVGVIERLTGAVGGRLRLRLSGDKMVVGTLLQVGPDWLLLQESPGGELLVALAALGSVEGLSVRTGPALSGIGARLDLRKALRAVARDRSPVTISTTAGVELSGTIDRVGADFIEVASHAAWEARRASAVRGVILVPLKALVMVRAVSVG